MDRMREKIPQLHTQSRSEVEYRQPAGECRHVDSSAFVVLPGTQTCQSLGSDCHTRKLMPLPYECKARRGASDHISPSFADMVRMTMLGGGVSSEARKMARLLQGSDLETLCCLDTGVLEGEGEVANGLEKAEIPGY